MTAPLPLKPNGMTKADEIMALAEAYANHKKTYDGVKRAALRAAVESLEAELYLAASTFAYQKWKIEQLEADVDKNLRWYLAAEERSAEVQAENERLRLHIDKRAAGVDPLTQHLRERAEKAEAECERLRIENNALRDAIEESGVDADEILDAQDGDCAYSENDPAELDAAIDAAMKDQP